MRCRILRHLTDSYAIINNVSYQLYNTKLAHEFLICLTHVYPCLWTEAVPWLQWHALVILTRVRLTRVRLTRVRLTRVRLTRVRLTIVRLTRVRLTRVKLTRVRLTRVKLTRVRLTRARLTGVRLTRARLTRRLGWMHSRDSYSSDAIPYVDTADRDSCRQGHSDQATQDHR